MIIAFNANSKGMLDAHEGEVEQEFRCVHVAKMENPKWVVEQCVAMMGSRSSLTPKYAGNMFGNMGDWTFIAILWGDAVVDFRVYDPFRDIITRDVKRDPDHPGHTYWWNGIGNNREELRSLGVPEDVIEDIESKDYYQSMAHLEAEVFDTPKKRAMLNDIMD